MTTRQFRFEVDGLDAFARRVQRAGALGPVTVNDGLRQIGRLFVPARGSGPLAAATPRRTGALARSTVFQVVGSTDDQALEIRQGARTPDGVAYGFFVRSGTRPHIIRPRNARALRWTTPGGDVVFAAFVRHPGTRPNPYHERVLAQMTPAVQEIVNRMGQRIVASLAG